MGASLGEVCRVTRKLCRKIKKKIKKKCLVSLLGRKLFRPSSYLVVGVESLIAEGFFQWSKHVFQYLPPQFRYCIERKTRGMRARVILEKNRTSCWNAPPFRAISGFHVCFQKVRVVCSIDGTLGAQEVDVQHAPPVPEHSTGVMLVRGRRSCGSFSTVSRPSLNALAHLNTAALLRHSLPN